MTIVNNIVAHWGLISVIAVAVISEILPFVKGTKADGILHGLLGLFQKSAPAIEQPKP